MTIAEVAEKYNMTADTLRYYERIGLLPPVTRTSGGIRNFTENDCNWVGFIKCMRDAGIPVEALIDYVNMFQQGDSTRAARKELLIEQRRLLQERIEALQKTAEHLDWKIKHYDKEMKECEKNLE
jgi:MerR family transcriptional regulator, aldehyde-responsive regulator